MRIAFIGPFGFHPNKTMRSRAFRLAIELVKRGHEVAMFMPPWQTPEEAGKVWQEDGVDITYVDLGGGIIGITKRLVDICLAWQPDVVHCFKPKAYSGLVAWWLWQTKRNDLKLVMDTDDWEGKGGWNDRAPYSPIQKRFFHWQEQWGMRNCHALTVASKTLQNLAVGSGVKPNQITYLPNGSGIGKPSDDVAKRRAELGLTNRPTLMLYTRLFEYDSKRLVEILKQVKAEIPELAVPLVGAVLFDEESADFRTQLTSANLTDTIIDIGWLDEADLPDTLASADVGIYLIDDTLLNRTKCPVKLVDMIACGLPVVAEAVGQVKEYIPEASGLLFPVGDIAGISGEIIHLLQHPDTHTPLVSRGLTHINAHFTWQRQAEVLELLYEKI